MSQAVKILMMLLMGVSQMGHSFLELRHSQQPTACLQGMIIASFYISLHTRHFSSLFLLVLRLLVFSLHS